MWWKFKQHRVAVASGIILLLMYASTLVTEILVPYNLHSRHSDFIYAPPQSVHLFHEGRLVGPFVYPLSKTLDMETLRRVYTEDTTRAYPLRFFCSGDPYEFWGLVEMSFHLVCPAGGRDAVPPRHGSPGPGRDVAHLLRRADLAHHRPAGNRHQLRAGARHRRRRGLFRRLDRPHRPARDRDHPLVPGAAAVDGAFGRAAGDVEPDPRLLRHHRHPGDAGLDRASPARCAPSSWRCARRTTPPPRA